MILYLYIIMLLKIWFGFSIFLIFLIVTRPPKTIGLRTITSKTNLLGSPSSAERTLNNVTISLIFIYCCLVLRLYY